MDGQTKVLPLIRCCRAGDVEAFTTLFEQYKNLVYKTAYLMFDNTAESGLDPAAEAEEALQEVFLQVHRHLDSYRPERGAFSTWLYRITVNHCLNRRRGRRWSWLSLDRPSVRKTLVTVPDPDLAETEAVRQALGGLSDKLRSVIILRFYADLSYAEIAETLDIPIGTVKSRLDLALKTLGRELSPSPQPSGRAGLAVEDQ